MKDVLWILLVSVLGPFRACLDIWAAVAALWVVTAPICIPLVWAWERYVPSAERVVGQEVTRGRAVDEGFDYLARSA